MMLRIIKNNFTVLMGSYALRLEWKRGVMNADDIFTRWQECSESYVRSLDRLDGLVDMTLTMLSDQN
ncbi:hypothetical protein SAMN04487788_1687 [Microbacterium testaceum StLB037]|uniref:Uncharacterized protein n=1 Tax=Microbacterium testaceum (strain StLB037) TaxID=979556 RepID=A0A1H0P1D6_MICTS|nr:hypothetical protein SAMN04487788_1687 [Microbacterium testaceum StLB037]